MRKTDVRLTDELTCTARDASLYRRNAEALRRVLDVWKMERGTKIVLRAPGYLDVTVEQCGEWGAVIASYWPLEGGDPLADSEMVLDCDPAGAWVLAHSYYNDVDEVYAEYDDLVAQGRLRWVNEHLSDWLANIHALGFRPAGPAIDATMRPNPAERD